MNKITINIDLTKLDKTRIQERTYTNKNGQEVTVKEYKMEVVPLNLQKTIKEGDTWLLRKTHFVCDAQTKEERTNKKETVYLGEGVMFQDRVNRVGQTQKEVSRTEDISMKDVTTSEEYSSHIPF